MPELAPWFEDPQQLGRTVQLLEQQASGRRNKDEACLRAYYDEPIATYVAEAVIDAWADAAGGSLTQELVDGAASMIVRSNSVKVSPVGGSDETLRHNCTQLELFIQGVKEQIGWPVLAHQAFIDAGSSTAGFVKFAIDPVTEEITGEREPAHRWLWDDREGPSPHSLFWVGPIPRHLLALDHPEHAEAIRTARTWTEPSIPGVDCTYGHATTELSPTVQVCEAWSKRRGKTDGRHVIAILGQGSTKAVLVDEAWTFDRFPVAVLRWMPAYRGFGGRSIAERAGAGDHEHRHWSMKLKQCLRAAMPIIQAQESEEIQGLTSNEQVWRYRIKPLEVMVPNTVSPELVKRLEAVRSREFERQGINQQLAKGDRPQGLNTDPAQRAWMDVVGTRLQPNQRLFNAFDLEAARCILMLATQYKKVSARVRAPGSQFLSTIRFADLKLKEDQYQLEVGLASDTEQTYAGKLARVADIQKVAPDKVPPAEMVRQLNNPDPAALERDINAARDLAHSLVSSAIDKGELEIPPDDPEVRQAVLEIGRQRLNRAEELRINGGPDAVVELNVEILRRLVDVVSPPPGLAQPEPAPPPVESPTSVGESPAPAGELPPAPSPTAGVPAGAPPIA